MPGLIMQKTIRQSTPRARLWNSDGNSQTHSINSDQYTPQSSRNMSFGVSTIAHAVEVPRIVGAHIRAAPSVQRTSMPGISQAITPDGSVWSWSTHVRWPCLTSIYSFCDCFSQVKGFPRVQRWWKAVPTNSMTDESNLHSCLTEVKMACV